VVVVEGALDIMEDAEEDERVRPVVESRREAPATEQSEGTWRKSRGVGKVLSWRKDAVGREGKGEDGP
jgi:hypothetical protein